VRSVGKKGAIDAGLNWAWMVRQLDTIEGQWVVEGLLGKIEKEAEGCDPKSTANAAAGSGGSMG
jgi:hypothetical protein